MSSLRAWMQSAGKQQGQEDDGKWNFRYGSNQRNAWDVTKFSYYKQTKS